MLIDQAAMLTLRLHLMDKESIADPAMSERNGRQYLAWANSLSRLLRQLGINATPPPQQRWQPYAPPVAPNPAPRAPDASA